jgi:hypothetical protein
MPNVFSIENINLNGSTITTNNGTLYVNNNPIIAQTGVSVNENLFIKGYAPLTFYSRLAIHGTYLNEIFLNDEFIATGWLITCSQPGTGQSALQGRFYTRKPTSVIDTQTISQFQLQTGSIFSFSNPYFYKVYSDSVIGLDIYSIPAEMQSLSINLLGYFAGAGHFDKVPKTFDTYIRGKVEIGYNIFQEYVQYDTTFTGIGIYAGESGTGPSTINTQYITGYLSGTLNQYPIYKSITGVYANSGYFVSGKKYNFPTGNQFSGFSGQSGFDNIWGYSYSGFEISRSGDNIFSGYYGNVRFGEGELLEKIGTRNYTVQEKIIGFRSGFLNESFVFSGFTGQQNLSGYFISGTQYYFPTGTGFANFSGQFGFDEYLGYSYTGFTFPEGVGFSGLTFPSSGTGILTGYIGHRNVLTGEFVSGFIKIISDYDFTVATGRNFVSGYFIDRTRTGFDTGIPFSGFDGRSGFDNYWGYTFSGFFPTSSGFSGSNFLYSGSGIMTGAIGYRYIPNLNPLSGQFYYKNNLGDKTAGPSFILNSGEKFYESTSVFYPVSGKRIIGFDIHNTLSGLSDVNIVLMGYYN